ncbi:MAG: cobalamin biosynthesis protein CobD [Acidobacteria bacterium]|nr:cobalamin biosynthesis protein CobD [Acidobacteriota bacterium]
MNAFAATLLPALALDLLAGDPRWLPHPVVAIGRWARIQETWWRSSGLALRWAGAAAWLCIVGVASCTVAVTLWLVPFGLADVYWIYSFLALRSLDQHAMAVTGPLGEGNLPMAREAVGWMVGRDTQGLDEPQVARALIETVAENTSDGVIAPLFWLCIAGPVGMAAYKAVNTLDSMFGYRNDRYREFGWWPARADDWANWIPARLTAALFWLVAFAWPGMNGPESVRITLRDAHKQPSPNSGYPEAAAAGALGIRLGGSNTYGGVVTQKQYLGDERNALTWRSYGEMRVLLFGASLLFAAAILGVRAWA